MSFRSARLQSARSRCRMTASLATASRISRPSSASRQNSLICSRNRLCSSVPIMMAPSMAPTTVPDPPKMLTPPTTTAATTCSSSPRAASTVILPKRARSTKPASPASAPESTKAMKTRRLHRQPDKRGGVGIGADRVEAAADRQIAGAELEDHHDGKRQHEHRADIEIADGNEVEARQVDQPGRQAVGRDRSAPDRSTSIPR